MALDEGHLFAGGALFAAGTDMIIKHMDGDRGLFAYGPVTDTYYPNLGTVGSYPLITPKVENYFYFVGITSTYTLDDTYGVSIQYRPRGVFLRGTNQ